MSRSENSSDGELDLSGVEEPQRVERSESKQQVQEKIESIRMIHEDKCEDGEEITAESRKTS